MCTAHSKHYVEISQINQIACSSPQLLIVRFEKWNWKQNVEIVRLFDWSRQYNSSPYSMHRRKRMKYKWNTIICSTVDSCRFQYQWVWRTVHTVYTVHAHMQCVLRKLWVIVLGRLVSFGNVTLRLESTITHWSLPTLFSLSLSPSLSLTLFLSLSLQYSLHVEWW